METGIKLKRAAIDDVGKFLKVENTITDTKTFSISADKEKARKEAAEDIINHFVYLIEKDGKIAGTISYELKNKNHAYLFGVVVIPELQRQGIAREAVKIILEMLKGVKLIDLVTHPENKKAIGLYTSLGFKKVGKQKENYFGDGEPRIKMVLKK